MGKGSEEKQAPAKLTHPRDVGLGVRLAAVLDLLLVIQEALRWVVAKPPVHAIEEAVYLLVSPLLVEAAIVVHLEYRLEETLTQAPEIRVIAQVPLSYLLGLRACEGRAVGTTLGLDVGQHLVDND